MASPLTRRLPREFRHNIGKYLGMFLLLVVAISLTSGFLTAASSIMVINNDMRERYNQEDFYVTTEFELGRSDKATIEAFGATVYENFYSDVAFKIENGEAAIADGITSDDGSVRIFANRTEFDLPEYCEGTAPVAANEIALDRVFCSNHDLHVGDTVTIAGGSYTICGIMTLADYTALFAENSGLIFNALTFAVSQVSDEAFEQLAGGSEVFRYSVCFDDRSLSLIDRTALEEDIVDALSDADVLVTDLADHESNQAISYASDDTEGDSMMWTVLLALIIVIMAFVFVVLTGATIEQESSVIGTLLASGYRKGELLRHYMALPVIVGLAGAVVGNILGYSYFTTPMQSLYYNSYSYPPFYITFDLTVFASTTILPLVLLFTITFIGIKRRLRATPLQFLRHESGGKKRTGGSRLPERLKFTTRFRIRVFLRNISHFATLFFGIMFGSLLLLFGLCLMPVIDRYATQMSTDIVASHLYVLKSPLELEGTQAERDAWAAAQKLATTEDLGQLDPLELAELVMLSSTVDEDDNPVNTTQNSDEAIAQAEKFATTTLDLPRLIGDSPEEITIYGIQPNSRYWTGIDVGDGKVAVGKGVFEKCGGEVGGTYTLTSRYTGDAYDVTVTSATGSASTMYIYMSLDDFDALFGEDAGYFNGYASDMPLELDSRYLATEITPQTMTAMTEQMGDSMGGMASMLVYAAVPIYLLLMYLLTKTVIDRSARAISYMKVFGYRDREVSRLYVRSITMVVVASLIACLPIILEGLSLLIKVMMSQYSGNLEIYIEPVLLVEVVLIGVATYAAVALVHLWRIRRVPLALAMKVQE